MSVAAGANWRVDWRAHDNIEAAIDYAWPVATKYVRDRAASNAPKKTGALSRSLKLTVQKRSATIVAQVPYSLYVHEGTSPHVIVPKNASVLVFEVGGETVFARKVNHPGTRPQPFLTDAAVFLQGRFAAAMDSRLS